MQWEAMFLKYRNASFIMRSMAITCILVFFLCTISYAHPGGTDENGGHYVKETGEYHFHHGYEAHQHINGVCPYDIQWAENENKEKEQKETIEPQSIDPTPSYNTPESNNIKWDAGGSKAIVENDAEVAPTDYEEVRTIISYGVGQNRIIGFIKTAQGKTFLAVITLMAILIIIAIFKRKG